MPYLIFTSKYGLKSNPMENKQPLRLILKPDTQINIRSRPHKDRTPVSPVFAVKTRYATDQKVKAHPFPSLQMRYIVLYSYYDRYTTTDVVTTGDTPTVNIWHAGKEEGT